MPHNHQKKIAVINDFCGFGRCSLAVSLPLISAMKIQCCPVPTAIFSNHTGFSHCYHTDFTAHMEHYTREWETLGLQFEGILTGFLGSPEQIDIVGRFLQRFKSKRTVVVVDPVMGDYGKLYPTYSPKLAAGMRALIPYADVITPNLTEACILAETDYRDDMSNEELEVICEKLSRFGPHKIVISGLSRGDRLENFVYENGKSPNIIGEDRVGPCRSGTGDVFSSIVTTDMVRGIAFADAVQHASRFIAAVLRRTLELDLPTTDGLCFEEFLTEIDTL